MEMVVNIYTQDPSSTANLPLFGRCMLHESVYTKNISMKSLREGNSCILASSLFQICMIFLISMQIQLALAHATYNVQMEGKLTVHHSQDTATCTITHV